jgi:hypothetical protein
MAIVIPYTEKTSWRMTEQGILFHFSHTAIRILIGIVFWLVLLFGAISIANPTNQPDAMSPLETGVIFILPLIGAAILVAIFVRLPGIRRLRYRLVTWDQVVLATLAPQSQSLQLSFVFKGRTNKDTVHAVPPSVQFTVPLNMGPSVGQFLYAKLGPDRVKLAGGAVRPIAQGTGGMAPSNNSEKVEWTQRLDGVKEGESVGELLLARDKLAFIKKHQIVEPLALQQMLELDDDNFYILLRDIQQLKPHGSKLKISYLKENRKVDKFDLKFNGRSKRDVLGIAQTLQSLVKESKDTVGSG